METVTTKVYNYTELSDEAKEKAREWYKEGDELPFLPEDINEQAHNIINNHKDLDDVVIENIFYSLSYCQGDGLMIEMTGNYKEFHFKVKQNGHYNHERSTTISLWNDECEEEDHEEFEEKVYIPICEELRDFGYDTIESMNNDEFVADALTNNDYQFYSDGSLYIEK
jgi:hypothetical protein